ncbi:phosphate ABC transporter substrate-binding protein PstS [Actinotalea sp. K2]|uniref:phosphate ABC transporter substrate-binding protein PstS n=1 Tax=Actinotalea sp. K2 TaxID=2939438 RepID=UPI0020170E9E|nr:phosphate ABC transporter substrate-binding protein PstS [Actinotalea sp. K2]MCL3861483.1 phosphate ABC transporter substrate-binding protein PstS [Actinotalea sp. K2]
MTPHRRLRTAAILVAAIALSGCGSDDPLGHPWRPGGPGEPVENLYDGPVLRGQLEGAGSSAQESAMQAWIAGFQNIHAAASVAYDPVGSGGGRTQFLEGGIQFGGSDAALNHDELDRAAQQCGEAGLAELPLYISPIAVIFNLDGISELQLTPATVARIFDRQVTRWDDPEIAADNPGVDLPDLLITPVARSDESGTTENFSEYLADAAGEAWPYPASGDWPVTGGQSAQGNSGVVQTVTDGRGTVGYADASKAGALGTVKVKVGDDFVGYSPEAAAAIVAISPREEGRPEGSLVVELDRETTEAGTYPIVLISYTLACRQYADPDEAALVRAFLSYVAGEEGQQVSALTAGSAPISDALRAEVQAVIDGIA